MLSQDGDALIYSYDSETLRIEPWGPNALRIRATHSPSFPSQDWALSQIPRATTPSIDIPSHTKGVTSQGSSTSSPSGPPATLANGLLTATLSQAGKLILSNTKTKSTLLEEFTRTRADVSDPKCSALNIPARTFSFHPGTSSAHLTYRIESISRTEKLYGMGQYQQPYLNLKGTDLELAHRNSQASVPFLVSSLGYGLLWNNPSIGRAVLGTNTMSFEARSTSILDYWFVAGDTPAEIISAYVKITGPPPTFPEYALGFWQCKLRYQTQTELLDVAREYARRKIKIDVIVVDFFHWPVQGTWEFDRTYFPDPDAMIQELDELGIKLLVSIWPTVDKRSPLYPEMLEKGYLIRQDRGLRVAMDFMGDTVHADFTNPKAREFVWSVAKKNYFDKGVKMFWLDEAEPEYSEYSYDLYRYHNGAQLEAGNTYPVHYAQAFYEGQKAAGQEQVCNLIRCAWAGSQRYGTLLWSGDIASSWESFRDQFAAGLNVGMAGISWWTTDIGGFHGGDPTDPDFRELCTRWFQWGCFCPVMRLHGDREPKQPQHGTSGGAECLSGAPNEIWSYGPRCEKIMEKYIKLRERLRPYVRGLFDEASKEGKPIIRTLFYEFPDDARCWEVEDQYMFGETYLVAPVMRKGKVTTQVYLPKGTKWRLFDDGEMKDAGDVFKGGDEVEVECELEVMPVFQRVHL